jgi:hypothetical protein
MLPARALPFDAVLGVPLLPLRHMHVDQVGPVCMLVTDTPLVLATTERRHVCARE